MDTSERWYAASINLRGALSSASARTISFTRSHQISAWLPRVDSLYFSSFWNDLSTDPCPLWEVDDESEAIGEAFTQTQTGLPWLPNRS